MTAALIAAIATLGGLVAGLVIVVRWGMRAKDETMAASDRLHAQTRMADETIMALVADRDQWKAKHDVAHQQLSAAKVRLAAVESQRNTAIRDERTHVAETLRNADAPTAARLGNRILSRPLPSLPKADPAAPGDGDRGAAALPAAGPAKPAP